MENEKKQKSKSSNLLFIVFILILIVGAFFYLRGIVKPKVTVNGTDLKINMTVQELVDAGVCAIFMTPVELDTSKEGVEIAAAAGVPVIVVDTQIQDSQLAACSVMSDNYQAGVLCAQHLLSVRDSAKILLLEHITSGSGADRIQGFKDTIAGHEGFQILGSG